MTHMVITASEDVLLRDERVVMPRTVNIGYLSHVVGSWRNTTHMQYNDNCETLWSLLYNII